MKLFNKYSMKKPSVNAPSFSSVVSKVVKNAMPSKVSGKKAADRKNKGSYNMGK